MALILASAWFNLVWFLAVIGSEQWQWVTLCFALMTLGYQHQVDQKTWKPTLLIAVVGCLVDSLNQYLSIFQFTSTFLPVWLFKLMDSFCLVRLSTEKNFAPFCAVLRINSRGIGGLLKLLRRL